MKHDDERFLGSPRWERDTKQDGTELAQEGRVDIWFGLGGSREGWEVRCVRCEFGWGCKVYWDLESWVWSAAATEWKILWVENGTNKLDAG
jgi:hypothetical protein